MMTISVAMTTYNGGKYLRTQLESLASQADHPDELVISDDGSTDDTVEIVAEFTKIAPFPVRMSVNRKRLGYAANFMHCASQCRSEWIAFCDQDDVWHSSKIEAVRRTATETEPEPILIIHDADIQSEEGVLGNLYGARFLHMLSKGRGPLFQDVLGLTMAFNRRLLEFCDLRLLSQDFNREGQTEAHDQWIYFLGRSIGTVSVIEDSLLNYRQHETNAFGVGPRGWRRQLRNLLGSGQRAALVTASSGQRATILSMLKERCTPCASDTLQLVRDEYVFYTSAMDLRRTLYESLSFKERWSILSRLIRMGFYTVDDGYAKALAAVVKDFISLIGLERIDRYTRRLSSEIRDT